jgi:hypothetical protein
MAELKPHHPNLLPHPIKSNFSKIQFPDKNIRQNRNESFNIRMSICRSSHGYFVNSCSSSESKPKDNTAQKFADFAIERPSK